MSTFLRRSAAAALLVLITACGGTTTSSNRDQRNAALEESDSTVPANGFCVQVVGGAVDPDTGLITFDFCDNATRYTIMRPDYSLPRENLTDVSSRTIPADLIGKESYLVAMGPAATGGYVDNTLVEKDRITVGDDGTVSLEKAAFNIGTTPCLRVNDGEVMASSTNNPVLVIPISATCEGVKLINYRDLVHDAPTAVTVTDNHIQLTAPMTGGSTFYAVNNDDGTIEEGTITVSSPPVAVTVKLKGDAVSGSGSDTTLVFPDTTAAPSDTTPRQVADTTVAPDTTVAAKTVDTLPTFDSVFGRCGIKPTVSVNPSSLDSGTKTQVIVKWPCAMETDRWADLSVSVLDEHEHQVANAGLGYSGTFDNGTFPSVDQETATVTVFDQYFEAGKYTVEVYTTVSRMVGDTYVENSEHTDLAMSVSAVENGFRWCRQDRISQSGPNLVMDCSVDSGTLTLDGDTPVDFSGGVFDLSDAAPGWHDGYLAASTGGSDFYGYLNVCTKSCDAPESSYDVTASFRDGTFRFAARQPVWCVNPIVTETSVWEYARGHGNLMWMMDSEEDGEGRDFGIEDPSDFQWTPNEGVDAVVVMGNPMWCTDADGNQRSERLRAMFMVQGSGNDSGSSVPDTTLATTDTSVPVNQINVVTIQLPMPTEGAGGGPSLVVVPEGTPTVSIPAKVVDGLIASVDGAQPFVLVETSDGHTVVLPEHRAGKVKVSAATDSVTVTAFDRKGTKHMSTVKVAHSVSYATLARSAGGSGFPVVPVTAAVVVLLVAAGLLQVRRKKSV